MNRLQRLSSSMDYFVTLNDNELIDPDQCIQTIEYTHPIYDQASMATQNKLSTLNKDRTFFCSYFGYGFHEDGASSALEVCRHFEVNA